VTVADAHSRPATCQQKMLQRAQRRAKTSKLFDSDTYLALHPDVMDAQLDAVEHFLSHGFQEGRRTAQTHAGPRLLGELTGQYEEAGRVYLSSFERAQTEKQKHHSFAQKNRVAVVCHTEGSPHMLPIARALRHALQAAGLKCTVLHQDDKALEHVTFPIVVAPHEFFQLPRQGYAGSEEFLYRAIAYNTEQLPSPWFSSGLKFLLCSRGVVDINFQSALVYGSDFPATHVLPPFDEFLRAESFLEADPRHPLFRSVDDSVFTYRRDLKAIHDRPIDIFFAGYKTSERNRVFLKNASYLAEKECFLAYTQLPEALANRPSDRTLFANNIALAASTKLVLNIHRYPMGFFEWERMVAHGFANGACIVATPGLPSPFFVAGRDYVEITSRNMGMAIKWLLDNSEGRSFSQQVATSARTSLDNQLSAERVGRYLVSWLADLDA
jgi:hypothetical protein